VANVKGWNGVGLMLARPAWLFVVPTAILSPLILLFAQRGKMGEGEVVGWGIGIVLLAMMMGGDKAKLRTTSGAKFEYVGMLVLMGGFAGIPTLLLGLPFLWLFGKVYDVHAMAISSAIGGLVGFFGLLGYAFKAGVSVKPDDSGRGGVYYDGGYDGRD
jgi:hypothetical protein